jgi:hypothetical protein
MKIIKKIEINITSIIISNLLLTLLFTMNNIQTTSVTETQTQQLSRFNENDRAFLKSVIKECYCDILLMKNNVKNISPNHEHFHTLTVMAIGVIIGFIWYQFVYGPNPFN